MNYISFGNKVKDYRNRAGYSQEQLSELVGLTAATISYLENGKRTPSLPKVIEIANVLKCGLDDLFADSLFVKSDKVKIEAERIGALLEGSSDEKIAYVSKHTELMLRDYEDMKDEICKEYRNNSGDSSNRKRGGK